MKLVIMLGKMVKGFLYGFEQFADTGFRYIEVPRAATTAKPGNRGGKLIKCGLAVLPPAHPVPLSAY